MAQENNPFGNNRFGEAVGNALAWAFVTAIKGIVNLVEFICKIDSMLQPKEKAPTPNLAKPANVATAVNAKIGDTMGDGTIFAGISPDTHQPMYAAPKDAPKCIRFNRAAKYAKGLEVGGSKGFRIPTKAELAVLFQNREKGALKGTFNVAGSFLGGWYWASKPDNFHSAWLQRFSDGDEAYNLKVFSSSVRPVR